jgi:hypothetical protein
METRRFPSPHDCRRRPVLAFRHGNLEQQTKEGLVETLGLKIAPEAIGDGTHHRNRPRTQEGITPNRSGGVVSDDMASFGMLRAGMWGWLGLGAC